MDPRTCRQIGRVAGIALAVATFLSAGTAQAQIADPIAVTNQVLALMNQERAKQNLPALTRQCNLDTAAARHANDMATYDYIGHTGSDGSQFRDRILQAGYTYKVTAAEINEVGAPTAAEAVADWMSSTSGHREMILRPENLEVGIAVAYRAGTTFRYYWCAVLTGGGTGGACGSTGGTGGAGGQLRSLGGTATAAPKAAYDADERLYLFVRGLDGAVWYRSRGDLTSNWGDWRSLGGTIQGNLSLGRVSGRLAVFARGVDNALWYTVRQGDGFTPWASLGGILTSDPVVQTVNGRARVFVRGTDIALWYRAQAATGQWLGWTSLGGGIDGAPMVTYGIDGQLIILARGAGGLWLRRDPEFQVGVDPSQLWSPISVDFSSRPDSVVAPGSRAGDLVFVSAGPGPDVSWTYQRAGQWLGGKLVYGDGSPCSRNVTGKIAVADRPGGGFYLATRRDGGGLCVLTAAVSVAGGLGISSETSASNVTGSGDLCVVSDIQTGRPVVFSLNSSAAVEERWF